MGSGDKVVLGKRMMNMVKQQVWAIAQERTVGVRSVGVCFSDAQVKSDGVRTARLLGGGGGGGDGRGPDVHTRCGD
jgi:hypothetical protein